MNHGFTQYLTVVYHGAQLVCKEQLRRRDGATGWRRKEGKVRGIRIPIRFTEKNRCLALIIGCVGLGEDAFELPASFEGAPCLTKDRIWVMGSGAELYAFGGGRPLARIPVAPTSVLQGCTSDAAVVRRRSDEREVAICTADTCRQVVIPSGAPEGSALTVVGGKLRAVASHGGVLGMWSEDKPPVFYALPVQARPVRVPLSWAAMALSDGKVIDIVARGAKSLVVARIPAQ